MQLSFFDAFTEQPINGDVNYDLKILDSDGNTILSKTNLTAKGAVDIQTLNLPGNGIYNIQINIKSIIGPTGLPDTSRVGLARGNVVIPSSVTEDESPGIPEFGSVAPIVLAIAVISIVVFTARNRGIPKL